MCTRWLKHYAKENQLDFSSLMMIRVRLVGQEGVGKTWLLDQLGAQSHPLLSADDLNTCAPPCFLISKPVNLEGSEMRQCVFVVDQSNQLCPSDASSDHTYDGIIFVQPEADQECPTDHHRIPDSPGIPLIPIPSPRGSCGTVTRETLWEPFVRLAQLVTNNPNLQLTLN